MGHETRCSRNALLVTCPTLTLEIRARGFDKGLCATCSALHGLEHGAIHTVFLGVGVVQRVKVELPVADTGVKHRGCDRRSTLYLVLAVEEHCQPLTYTVSRCGAISIT